jgi:glycosyltransferase involved in cell wall biosynthesis
MDNISLIVAGDGPYLKTMQAALQGTPSCFTGYVTGETLARLYASSDLFVFPSTTDTFGNVVLEAQASGLPVIVTDSGGPQENMLPGKTGVVVPADDANALLETIQTLINRPEKLKALGKAGRQYMEERSFESAFNETWKIYEEQWTASYSHRETFAEAV